MREWLTRKRFSMFDNIAITVSSVFAINDRWGVAFAVLLVGMTISELITKPNHKG